MGAKPVASRKERKKFDALDFSRFNGKPEEEKKSEKPDVAMKDDSYADVTDQLRKSKRNKTPVYRDDQ